MFITSQGLIANAINAWTPFDWLIDLFITSQRLVANAINARTLLRRTQSANWENVHIRGCCSGVLSKWLFYGETLSETAICMEQIFYGQLGSVTSFARIQSQPPTQRNAKISQKKHLKIGTKKCCFSVYSRHQNTLQDVKSNKSFVTLCDEVQNLSKLCCAFIMAADNNWWNIVTEIITFPFMKLTQSAWEIWYLFLCVLVLLFHRGGVHNKPTASQMESKWGQHTAPWASWGGKPRNRETKLSPKFKIPNITILREGINQSRNQNYRSFAEIEIDDLTLKGSAHNYWN